MRVICSAASALSAPGRLSTITGWPICSDSAWPMMRVVGSAEPPGGKPTTKRIGFAGDCAEQTMEAESIAGGSSNRCTGLLPLLVTQEILESRLSARTLARLEVTQRTRKRVELHQGRERIVKDDGRAAVLLERAARHVDDH